MTSKFIAAPLALLCAAACAAPEAVPITGQGFHATAPDPKRPTRLAWEMWGREGTGIPKNGGYAVHATGVTAYFYQKGAKSARLTADAADGDSATKQVVARGRASVRMLDKTNATLRAQTITWYSAANLMVARGDVHYQNPKSHFTMTCAVMTYDATNKTFHTGVPYATELKRRAQ